MKYRSVFLAILLAGSFLLGMALTGCQPEQISVETAGKTQPAEVETGKVFQGEYYIREKPSSSSELEPGLYCLTAVDGEGSFLLAGPGQAGDRLIREQRFFSRAWVEVRAGELLTFSQARIESYEERKQQNRFPSRLRDGFFLIGVDIFPGVLRVQRSEYLENEPTVCEVYATAHDLSDGPVQRYEIDGSPIEIVVEEGEFLLLRNAEAYIPPS